MTPEQWLWLAENVVAKELCYDQQGKRRPRDWHQRFAKWVVDAVGGIEDESFEGCECYTSSGFNWNDECELDEPDFDLDPENVA